jgi:D-alanyl-D-alanine carboxypeptidase
MLRLFTLCLALLISVPPVFAQIRILNEAPAQADLFDQLQIKSQHTSPQTRGSDLFEALDLAFDGITGSSNLKGFNAALRTPEGEVWKRAVGVAQEIPDTVDLNTEHLMGMGSISKSFVSATLLLLVEDGLLSLDDTIGMYLDDYPNIDPSANIKQLLSHRTGYNDYLNENIPFTTQLNLNLDSIWEPDTILKNYILPSNFEVGEDWSYSNTNYLLAGKIIENVTGLIWHEVVRDRILVPMGLSHTFTYPYEDYTPYDLAHCFADIDLDNQVEDFQGSGFSVDGLFSAANSAGCLITTPEDLVQFSKELYGTDFLEPSTLAEMQTNYSNIPGFSYGLGAYSLSALGLPNWGHDGSVIYKSIAFYFPSEDIAIAVQQTDNRVGPDFIDVNEVLIALLNAYLNYSPVAVSKLEQEAVFQLFPNPANDQLIIDLPGQKEPEQPLSCSLFDVQGRILGSFILTQNQTTLNLTDLPKGIYALRLGNEVRKFVIQK